MITNAERIAEANDAIGAAQDALKVAKGADTKKIINEELSHWKSELRKAQRQQARDRADLAASYKEMGLDLVPR